MTRLKRNLVIAAVLLVLVAVGVWLLINLSTRNALLRAEAFLFRRAQVTRLDDGTQRYFYVTNRVPGDSFGRLEQRYRPERDDTIRYGSYDAEFEPTLGLSAVFDPTKWFRNEEVEIRVEQELTRSELVRQLRAYVRESPHRSLLIVVHGYREQFESALRKTAFVSHVLDINTPVLLFDWPGDQPGTPLVAYRRAVEVAEESGTELARTLEIVLREIEPDSDQITLVDVTPVNRTINFHNFYLESPEVFNDLFLRLLNPENPHTRVLYPIRTGDGSVYWILTRGR